LITEEDKFNLGWNPPGKHQGQSGANDCNGENDAKRIPAGANGSKWPIFSVENFALLELKPFYQKMILDAVPMRKREKMKIVLCKSKLKRK
jgi:hypothetical protein